MIRESNGRYWHDEQEISAEEYSVLLAEIKAKAQLVDHICAGTATLDDCPEEWREEIAARVEARKNEPEPEPDAAEILNILTGGAT